MQVPYIPHSSILFLGDSVTHGVRDGVTESQTFRALVAAVTGCPCIDAGVPGDNSAMMLARLPALLQQRPGIVVIMSGINDALPPNNMAPSAYYNNLLSMIGLCDRAFTDVLLLTPNAVPAHNELKPYVGLMRYLAAVCKIALADAYQVFAERTLENGANDFMVDAQHPNPAGHAAIASEINWALTRNFGGR